MVSRRSFMLRNAPSAALGLAALGSEARPIVAAEASPTPFFELVTVRLQFGAQLTRFPAWLEKRALPLFEKHRFGTMAFFTVEVGPTIPSVVALFSFASLAEEELAWARLEADPDWSAAMAEAESPDPAFYREDWTVLRATPFSRPLKASAAGDPPHKVYELRIYESATERQLGFLHDRFAGGEIEVFHKSGIHPVLYADTYAGPNMPNMVYLIPFESEAHREKAWAAFRDNPDWQKLRDESVRRGGEIVRNITNLLLTPASFSMLR